MEATPVRAPTAIPARATDSGCSVCAERREERVVICHENTRTTYTHAHAHARTGEALYVDCHGVGADDAAQPKTIAVQQHSVIDDFIALGGAHFDVRLLHGRGNGAERVKELHE